MDTTSSTTLADHFMPSCSWSMGGGLQVGAVSVLEVIHLLQVYASNAPYAEWRPCGEKPLHLMVHVKTGLDFIAPTRRLLADVQLGWPPISFGISKLGTCSTTSPMLVIGHSAHEQHMPAAWKCSMKPSVPHHIICLDIIRSRNLGTVVVFSVWC